MSRVPKEIDGTALRIEESASAARALRPQASPAFVRFHFTSVEISTRGGGAHVRSRSVRLEDGCLRTETFEGDVDRGTFDTAAQAMQRQAVQAWSGMFGAMLAWLPGQRRRRD